MNEKEITALKNIVRTGKVSSTSAADRTVRVAYDGDGMVSGPLKVVKNPPFIPSGKGPQQTEATGGGSGYAAFESHAHAVKISPWFPSVGEDVLCICLPNDSGDGFVIGGL